MEQILKYPRTRHVEGSRHQVGDTPEDVPISALAGCHVVVEEKLDGSNSGISFGQEGDLRLQSRGHYLMGGPREKHFSLFKTWANAHAAAFWPVFGTRYIVYGEVLSAKHTVFYDALTHYWMEFDIWDREREVFLSTEARRELLFGLPIVPVPVLYEGEITSRAQLEGFLRPTLFRTPDWRTALSEAARASGSREEMVAVQSDDSELAEGLYLKIEKDGVVVDRLKYVRGDFLQTIQTSDSHWHDRPILLNGLAKGVDIFAPQTGVKGAYDDLEMI